MSNYKQYYIIPCMVCCSFKDLMSSNIKNKRFFAEKCISWVIHNLKDAFGYCCRNKLSLNEYLPPERFGNQKNQITVFISVRLSELWENAIYETIKELFGQLEIDIDMTKRWTTSDGDISILNEVWEIKTSQSQDSWTGATHSSHKVPRYILVHYTINKDIKLDLINDSDLFPEFSIYLIDEIENDEKIWSGAPTKNSSFTTLKIKNEWIDEGKVICIWGDLVQGKGKYAKIVHHKNPINSLFKNVSSEIKNY